MSATAQAFVCEQSGWNQILFGGQHDVTSEFYLLGKELVGTHRCVIGHFDRRMIGAQLPEKNIEANRFDSLRGQLPDKPAIDLPRPEQTVRLLQQPAPNRSTVSSSANTNPRLSAVMCEENLLACRTRQS